MKRDDEPRLRVPPHSVEMEQSVLGALLLDNAVFDRVGDRLTATSFYRHEHRVIFEAIAGLILACKPADVLTVFERIAASPQVFDGSLEYLNSLACCVPSSANAGRYADVVADRALKRAIIAAADQASSIAWSDGDALEQMDQVGELFSQLATKKQRSAPKRIDSLLIGAIDRYNALASGDVQPGMKTGFNQLDKMLTGGLKPGKLYCIAARPSIGKSSIARAIGMHCSKDSKVLLLSQEMPQEEQTDCVVSALGRIDSERLQTGAFSDDDWSRLSEAIDEATRLDLHFDEQGALTIGQIRAKARALKGVGLLIVDYLQLCGSTLKGKTTNDEIGEVTKGLKALAMEMRIPIIVLSQLNRDVEKRADKEPTLADLRDSGNIEQDIDIAVFLWTMEERDDDSRTVGIKVAKHRGGRKGSFAMRFDAPIYLWTDCQWPEKPAAQKGQRL